MLEELLTNEDRAAGFFLEVDDHTVFVFCCGKKVGVFSGLGMTRESLREFLDSSRPADK
jgi:hypothetical protein